MIESTLEQFPQLTLMIYVIRIEIEQGCDVDGFQWLKIAVSCFALCLSIGMIKENTELRLDDQNYEIPKHWLVLFGRVLEQRNSQFSF